MKLRKISPPRGWDKFPGLVQVSQREGDRYHHTQMVYLDGVEVGKLDTYMSTPRVPIARGSRIGKDLKRRRVWAIPGERMRYEELWRAVRAVLNDHLGK